MPTEPARAGPNDYDRGRSFEQIAALHEKRGMTPEMAARVAKLLNTTPESWLRMQQAVDLWEVEQQPEKLASIKPIKAELMVA